MNKTKMKTWIIANLPLALTVVFILGLAIGAASRG